MTSATGRRYSAAPMTLDPERIRQFARAVGETDAIYFDDAAARGRGYAGQVAPPMFASVYTLAPVMAQVIRDEELGLELPRAIHGEQEFTFHRLALAGESLSAEGELIQDEVRSGLRFVTVRSVSRDARGEPVAESVGTLVVRL
jgi:acyl dehydratase